MSAPIVDTTSGPVLGAAEGDQSVFRGIRYAAAPIGPHRFAPPVAPEPWTEPFDATAFGPAAPQNPSMLESMLGGADIPWDEDCLRLNVWTPGCDDARRPVMVWIHGGAFVFGSGATPWYDGEHLAARGTVVVTINYRLGAFGFLHLAGLADGFAGSGNVGLLDQVAALHWVRDNIARFGGDPSNVTVFGESAGAMSIGTLLAMPAAAGLFRRAILESGAASTAEGTERATEVAQKFLAAVGCEVGELRDVPATELLAAQEAIAGSLDEGLNFVPVIDGVVLPDAPLARLRGGSAAGVDVLIGTNADEMTMFLLLEPALAQLSPEGFGARIDAPFADKGLAPGTADATYRQRLGDATPTDVLTAVAGDQTFRIPAIRLAEAQVAAGGAAWMYLFTYPSPAAGGMLKSSHALEIPFAWDNLDAPGVALFAGDVGESHRALAAAMADAWVAFATEGLPAAVGLPDWPAYDTDRRATMRLDVDASEVLDDPWGPERALWDGLDP